MKKHLSLLALPVLLLMVSCSEGSSGNSGTSDTTPPEVLEMTKAEIADLYAKGESAVINTIEMSSISKARITGDASGITLNGTLDVTEFTEFDLRDGVNLLKNKLTQKSTDFAIMTGADDIDLSIETYFNGVDTIYSKITDGTSVEKNSSSLAVLDFKEIMDVVMTRFAGITSFFPVDMVDTNELTPKITKQEGIYTFSYDMSDAMKETGKELGLGIETLSAKTSTSLNEDGLIVNETINIKMTARNPNNSMEYVTLEVSGSLNINYNKDLHITAPTDLNTYY